MNITPNHEELAYLRGQKLGRLATVDRTGAPQNNPVGYFVDVDSGTISIAGTAMGDTRKYRNVRQNGSVSLVVDDLASTDPWRVRGVEIRGTAEALRDVEPPMAGLSRELIRITPRWIGSWGLGEQDGLTSRGVRAEAWTDVGLGGAGRVAAVAAVPQLLDSYFQGFDDRRHDEAWLASIFHNNVRVDFPAGSAKGLTQLSGLSRRILDLWSATLHQTTNHVVVETADGADFSAALTATHVHRPGEPGAHLRIGARVSGSASSREAGWRIDDLTLQIVWTEGEGPNGFR